METLYPLSQAWSKPIAGAGSPGLESYQPSVQVALATQKLGVWERCLYTRPQAVKSAGVRKNLEGALAFKRSIAVILPPFTQRFRGV